MTNQRRLDDWYLRVVDGLDRVISDIVDCGFTITLEFQAIAKEWIGIVFATIFRNGSWTMRLVWKTAITK